jgi:hypothetical protein
MLRNLRLPQCSKLKSDSKGSITLADGDIQPAEPGHLVVTWLLKLVGSAGAAHGAEPDPPSIHLQNASWLSASVKIP